MTFFTLLFALAFEQWRPLKLDNPAYRAVQYAAAWLEDHMDVGDQRHGRWAWWGLVGGICLGVYVIYLVLYWLLPPLAFVWNVAVLFMTLGFRQFSHYYTDIQFALSEGDLPAARGLLHAWKAEPSSNAGHNAASTDSTQFNTEDLSLSEIVRHTLIEALLASHRHVFGVLLCFVLLPGPLGAVLYRLANYLARRWNRERANLQINDPTKPRAKQATNTFGCYAQRAFEVIDWLPARVTAFVFAVVGNFEDAIYCWKTCVTSHQHASFNRSSPSSQAILLAAGEGAMGVQITESPSTIYAATEENGNAWRGASPSLVSLKAGVGMVWRAIILWFILILFISIAYCVG